MGTIDSNSRIRRDEQFVFINGVQIPSVQSVQGNYTNNAALVKFLGNSNQPIIQPRGPQIGDFSISTLVMGQDLFLQYTGNIGFNGYVIKNKSNPKDHRIALVLQGGGALGAYQAGVYQALHEHNLTPNWVVGTSIGANNAAIIAGNPRDVRLERLQEFWNLVEEQVDLGYITRVKHPTLDLWNLCYSKSCQFENHWNFLYGFIAGK